VGAYEYPLIIKQLLITPLRQCADQEIIYRDQKRFTYRQFGERLARLGSALQSLGIRHGDTVAVMDWDTHRYLECFFAVPMSGAVLQTVNIRLSVEQIVYTINHARADAILCNAEFAALLAAVRPLLSGVKKIVCLTDDGVVPSSVTWDGEYEALLAAGDPAHVFPDFDENTRATTFYTTGTTGNPKGVYYTHRQLVLHTLNGLAMLPFSDTDVYMPLTPMFHVHAWGNPYNATARGLKQVYPGRYQPEILVKLFVTERVTFSHCVPTILQMILAAAPDVDLRGWRLIIGGSALPRALAQAALARGIDVFAGYGMSETGPMATIALLPQHLRDGGETELTYRCRAGRPVGLVDVRILGTDGAELPHDGHSTGEIVARSPALTAGYAKNPDASATLWKGGWLHTGDIGTLDRDGYLHVLDRSKDVIKTGGEWISSLGLEDIILGNPGISECAVIGVEDARWGERPIAVVVAKPGAAVTEDEVKAMIRARAETGELSRYAVPDHVVFAESLEKTSVGKLDKKKMRVLYGAVKAA